MCRLHDALLDLLHELFIGERDRRYGTHAAGVEARVALADTFVVFGRGEDLVVFAVGSHKDRAFDAAQELLDDHAGAGDAELSVEHCGEFLFCGVEVVEDHDALTGCEAVGLEYERRFYCFEEGLSLFEVCFAEGAECGGRDSVAGHECLGELLAAFEAGALA